MKIALDYNSHIPLYIQIEEGIRNMIQEPEYKKEKKKLPNEVDFSRQLGVSRNTMRQAINKLVYEGLLIRKKGVGTVVADIAITSKAGNWMSFSQEMKTLGIEVKNYELHITWEKPTQDLCRFFDIDENTQVLKLARLRGNPDYPFVYFVSYFNPRIKMTGNEDFSRPLYDILENDYNIIVKLSREEVSAKPADASLSEKLKIKAGDPVLKRKRFV
ncbi:MAG: GntR family transcriptional regulator, partial [Dysgonamonadaceae bacterium]|nr:GntR family transcriptional regulator [Dysgonamonadaceae bacterium]